MYHTPFGYELRMVGANIKFARYGGVNTKRTIVLAMAVSGIFAGLAGAHLASGIHRKLILNISYGLGFEGIVVAILARNNPLLVPFTGLMYGYLRAGANVMERSSDVSREMVLVIQGIIILLVTAERILPIIQERIRIRRSQKAGIPPADAEVSSTGGGD
jgi:simple sugar transport system permease protein